MMRVHSTCASGASAIAVPGWPLLAAWGASMARPRMTLMARCSRAGSGVMYAPPYWPALTDPVALAPVSFESCRCGSRVLEHEHAGGEPVDEAAAADRPDLAGAEHPGEGRGVEQIVDHTSVVVRLAENPLTTSVAREHQRAVAVPAREHGAKVLVGGGRVPHVELDGGADVDLLAHRQRPAAPVCTQDRANEEVATAERLAVLVYGDAEVQPRRQQGPLAGAGRPHQIVEPIQRRQSRELVHEVALGPGHDHRLADRPAPLRHHRRRGDLRW